MNILVSACLLGTPCRYDGKSQPCEAVQSLSARHTLIPVCPEVEGGLPTPRTPAERQGVRTVTRDGRDVTAQYRAGAQIALVLCREKGCRYAILKERSPSCGSQCIYDGSFTGALTDGQGVTAELLRANGVTVLGESQIDALQE